MDLSIASLLQHIFGVFFFEMIRKNGRKPDLSLLKLKYVCV